MESTQEPIRAKTFYLDRFKVSTFQKRKESELLKINQEMSSKSINPQGYFNYRAREEQIKFELTIRQHCLDLLSGSFYDAVTHYGHALNHLKRRDGHEKKMYAVWLQRVKAQEHPPEPDWGITGEFIQNSWCRNEKTS